MSIALEQRNAAVVAMEEAEVQRKLGEGEEERKIADSHGNNYKKNACNCRPTEYKSVALCNSPSIGIIILTWQKVTPEQHLRNAS